MTSRVRRIVLAMYGYNIPNWGRVRALASVTTDELPTSVPPHCGHDQHHFACYEAMDDLDYSPIVGGNYGLPCA